MVSITLHVPSIFWPRKPNFLCSWSIYLRPKYKIGILIKYVNTHFLSLYKVSYHLFFLFFSMFKRSSLLACIPSPHSMAALIIFLLSTPHQCQASTCHWDVKEYLFRVFVLAFVCLFVVFTASNLPGGMKSDNQTHQEEHVE